MQYRSTRRGAMGWLGRAAAGTVAGLMGLALLTAGGADALARDRHDNDRDRDHDKRAVHWVGTWTASPSDLFADGFNNQTLRLIAHTSIGGNRVRVRLSNTFGTESLKIGEAHIAVQSDGASIRPESDRTLRFGGSLSTTIPPGALAVSDPVELDVKALSNLSVSVYLPEATGPITQHSLGMQDSYATGAGNFTAAADLPVQSTRQSWALLSAIEVLARESTRAVVTFGDSITDGFGSTVNANHRWPNILAERLKARRIDVAVLDQGISGNRVLHEGQIPAFGPSALSRFDRDVLAQSGVKYLVVMEGINDFGHAPPGSKEEVFAEDIIAGYKQIIRRARAHGIKVYGATLTPYKGTIFENYYQPEGEAKRQAVNAWIRGSGAFDAVIDFEAAVRDPADPTRMLPAYDVGDHLHPNDAGYKAMADSIDLRLFKDND